MDAYLIVGNNIDLSKIDFLNNFVIGVDRGALIAMKNKIKLDVAIGDFDSISAEELKKLKATKIIKLNPVKDETDTVAALELVKDFEHIYLLGAIQGKRIEHLIANVLLFKKYPNLIMIDDNSTIRLCDYEENFQKDEYAFYSFFALETVKGLSLKGFKFELNNYELDVFDTLAISNEIISDAKLSYRDGQLLLIKSKKE